MAADLYGMLADFKSAATIAFFLLRTGMHSILYITPKVRRRNYLPNDANVMKRYQFKLSLLGLALLMLPDHARLVRGRETQAGALEVIPARIELAGVHQGRQLIVSAADPKLRDVTRIATFSVENPKIVRVTGQGYVRPLGKGQTSITVEFQGQKRQVPVAVKDFDDNRPLHFANDIVPLLSRHGCNAGGCHGQANGQNGFKLSLFGFDADFDYNALVKEAPPPLRTIA